MTFLPAMRNTAFYSATLTAVLSLGFIGNAYALTPFTASYAFNLDNKASGTATRKLSQQGNLWTYDFTAQVPVLARASEKSTFHIDNGQVVAQSYQRQYKILVHTQTTSLNFNSANKVIYVTRDKKASQMTWQPGVLDDLNVEMQIREDLKKGGLKSSYLIADQKAVTPRRFVNQGKVKITTPSGTYDTIKVQLDPQKNNKSTIFWLAPSLDYLPVKVTHTEDNSVYSLTLTSYKPV